MRPLLENISSELTHRLERIGRRHSYSVGHQIFAECSDAAFLPILVSGSVKMIRTPAVGREIILGIFRQGEMFAVPPVFDGHPYPASAYALEETVLLQIARQDFLQLLRESSEFAFVVIAWMSEMLRDKVSIIRNLAIASPEQRIGNILLKLTEQRGGDLPVTIALRRQDIAEMASLTTETTIRAIRRLADQRLMRIVHGKIIVDEVESLRQFLQA